MENGKWKMENGKFSKRMWRFGDKVKEVLNATDIKHLNIYTLYLRLNKLYIYTLQLFLDSIPDIPRILYSSFKKITLPISLRGPQLA